MARQPLRRTIIDALRKVNPTITVDRAFLSAKIMMELIKGLLAVCKQTVPNDRDAVAVEFKKMMRLHLVGGIALAASANGKVKMEEFKKEFGHQLAWLPWQRPALSSA